MLNLLMRLMTFLEIVTFMRNRKNENDIHATENENQILVHPQNGANRSNVLGDVQATEITYQTDNERNRRN